MYMFKYILKRIGLMLMTFAIIVSICFILIKLLPISFQAGFGQDKNKLQELYAARGYDKPILYQLFIYVKRIITQGDFGIGTNIYFNKSVTTVFGEFLPPTILINIYSSIIAIPIGIGLGIFAALKKNKWQDHVISTGVMLLISVPSFVYGVLILYFLCFKAGLFPLKMDSGYDYFSWSMFKSMFPATLSLSLGSIAGYTRYTRAELTEVLTSEFMLLARTKGLTKSQATVRHALRNAMVPIFPSIIGEFIGVLQGSLVIENIFAIPGVGHLYLSAINAKDYDFFMFISAFYTLVGLAAGLVIDLSYGIIDPRIRMGAK
ncbi:MAG: ABC transporter permease [Bacilli bacterium]|nr:ABC transporter permease [Mollicutes bacterium]MDY3899485.1 ABC transporter permease [Bacilli bacterium]